ncbi:hypothetical protein [Streptomyces actuosus]|uniref:hypothetical protein n=1 Tax=Streptomyces actuosus TaxID=1885 RepID=UPI0013A6AE56|nr:hypothetical protein [Streptomyces actuosus]
MDQLAIVEWGLASAAVVYAVLGVAARVRRRAHDRLSASLTDFEVDPYLAVATTLGLDEVDRAAAAALIVDGMAGIDSENRITLTERGAKSKSTPQHPVPAALLKALRRMRTPAYLRRLRDESGYRERRDDFLSQQRARVPAWPAAHRTDTLFRTGVLALTALSLFYAVPSGMAGQGSCRGVAGVPALAPQHSAPRAADRRAARSAGGGHVERRV